MTSTRLLCALLGALPFVTATAEQVQYDDLRAAIFAAHEHRAQLLRSSRGQAHLSLQIEVDSQKEADMKQRVQKELGGAGRMLPASGQGSWSVKWQQSGDKRRFDVLSDPPSGDKSKQPLLPRHYRAATDSELFLLYDIPSQEAYLSRPASRAFNPRALYDDFEVMRVYYYTITSVPQVMDGLEKQGVFPKVTTEELDGALCFRLTFTRIRPQDQRVTDIWFDPQKAYSVVKMQYHYQPGDSSELLYDYEASYAESKDQPGVWLLATVRLTDRHSPYSEETLEATFATTEVGVPIPPEVFSLEGMEVPRGTPIFDRRLPGESFRYICDEVTKVSLDGIQLPPASGTDKLPNSPAPQAPKESK